MKTTTAPSLAACCVSLYLATSSASLAYAQPAGPTFVPESGRASGGSYEAPPDRPRSVAMMVNGIVLSGLATIAVTIGVTLMFTVESGEGCPGCNVLVGTAVASTGAPLLATGIPLWAVGAGAPDSEHARSRRPGVAWSLPALCRW